MSVCMYALMIVIFSQVTVKQTLANLTSTGTIGVPDAASNCYLHKGMHADVKGSALMQVTIASCTGTPMVPVLVLTLCNCTVGHFLPAAIYMAPFAP